MADPPVVPAVNVQESCWLPGVIVPSVGAPGVVINVCVPPAEAVPLLVPDANVKLDVVMALTERVLPAVAPDATSTVIQK